LYDPNPVAQAVKVPVNDITAIDPAKADDPVNAVVLCCCQNFMFFPELRVVFQEMGSAVDPVWTTVKMIEVEVPVVGTVAVRLVPVVLAVAEEYVPTAQVGAAVTVGVAVVTTIQVIPVSRAVIAEALAAQRKSNDKYVMAAAIAVVKLRVTVDVHVLAARVELT
jgi:hypothetical protein